MKLMQDGFFSFGRVGRGRFIFCCTSTTQAFQLNERSADKESKRHNTTTTAAAAAAVDGGATITTKTRKIGNRVAALHGEKRCDSPVDDALRMNTATAAHGDCFSAAAAAGGDDIDEADYDDDDNDDVTLTPILRFLGPKNRLLRKSTFFPWQEAKSEWSYVKAHDALPC